jgi:hypothetical protein
MPNNGTYPAHVSLLQGTRGTGFAGPLGASPLRGEAASAAQGGDHFATTRTISRHLFE